MKMSYNRWRLLAIACWLLTVGTAYGQEQIDSTAKIITSSRMMGFGATRLLDTYLSAEHFKGTGFSFLATIERQKPNSRWSTLMEHEANLSAVHDRTNTEKELEGAYNFYWGRLYGFPLFNDRLKLQVGGMVNASLGFIYNTSNIANNPAQARAHLNLMPVGVASYRFQLFHKPALLRYEEALPLVGILFSPNYGQSYYEIFSRGDYDHNAVPVTFVTAPEWRQMLTLDAAIAKKWTLRIGYLGNYQQYKVNNLKQHVYTHRILIGITKRFSITTFGLNEKAANK